MSTTTDTPTRTRTRTSGSPGTDPEHLPTSTVSPLDRSGPGLTVVKIVVIIVAMAWTLVPLLWMVLSSFKNDIDATAPTPKIIFSPVFDNYTRLFSGANNLATYLWHSVVVAVASAVLATAIGAVGGYGLAKTRMRGKRHLAFWIISTRMAPIAAVVLPLFLIFRYLHLIDTLPGLILAYLTFDLPFAFWLMSAFYAEVPDSIEESALVAGCTRWQAFRQVVLPLTTSGLVTTFVLCLVFAWNDYAFALVFSGPHSQTLPLAASQLVTQTGIDWGQLCAIGTIVVVPMMAAGLAVRRWLVTGLTLGAVTGE